jgi:mono/diheme cytochrome c family protein
MLARILIIVVLAVQPAASAERVDYGKVKAILKAHCVRCHGVRKQEADLRLDTAAAAIKGTKDGPVIVAGKPRDSRLLKRVSSEDKDTRMPPEGAALSAREIATLTRWIEAGAPHPADETPESDPTDHWAYRAPLRPQVPNPAGSTWARNPIDAFLAEGHRGRKLLHAEQAEAGVLLRRATLDLTGLPPTPEEIHQFLADTRPDRWNRTIGRLLQNPRYGERWGRHWMDVWRYSDWYGYQKQLRNSSRHIWRWRDWIVESLNANRPYDEMVRQMLAADELPEATPETLRATGFLARNYYLFNRNTWLDATIEHTGKAFLGLTINCARCHDHMYDPVAQKDYYRFRAIFEPHQIRTDPIDGRLDVANHGISLAYDAKPKTPTYLFERGNDKRPDKDNPLTASVPSFLPGQQLKVSPVELSPIIFYPGLREPIREGLLETARRLVSSRTAAVTKLESPADSPGSEESEPRELAVARKELTAARAQLESLTARVTADTARYHGNDPAAAATAASLAAARHRQSDLIAAEAGVLRAELSKAQAKASSDKKKISASSSALAAARKKLKAATTAAAKTDANYPPLTKVYPKTSTGRRLALARWITDRRNPLTARVCVNHVWLRHFGSPLVPSVFDFGNNGRRPTFPALLDWLAVELMDHDWDLEHLHRLILTSAAYRMSSGATPAHAATRKRDPDNRFLWRMNSRRLESELVRDSVLWVCGNLDARMGGPELDAGTGLTTTRRSIYYRHAPEKMMVFLDLFDSASTHECYQRNETVVPQQALAMVNSPLAIEQSRRLARRLDIQVGLENTPEHSRRFLDTVFLRVLGRGPSRSERTVCLEFLAGQASLLGQSGKLTPFGSGQKIPISPAQQPHLRARENLVLVLLNHNEFLTIR